MTTECNNSCNHLAHFIHFWIVLENVFADPRGLRIVHDDSYMGEDNKFTRNHYCNSFRLLLFKQCEVPYFFGI